MKVREVEMLFEKSLTNTEKGYLEALVSLYLSNKNYTMRKNITRFLRELYSYHIEESSDPVYTYVKVFMYSVENKALTKNLLASATLKKEG